MEKHTKMSLISIKSFLAQLPEDKKLKMIKMFVSKILTEASYLVVDEKTHCKLIVSNAIRISQGKYVKITFCEHIGNDIMTTLKSEVFNCSPFKCLQISENILQLYNDGQTTTQFTPVVSKMMTATTLKNIDIQPGKVNEFVNLGQLK